MEKICTKCEEKKELNKFDKLKKSKDGYRNKCMVCMRQMSKIRYESLSSEEKERRELIKKERNKIYWSVNMKDQEFKLKEKNRRRKYHIKILETDPLYRLRIAY